MTQEGDEQVRIGTDGENAGCGRVSVTGTPVFHFVGREVKEGKQGTENQERDDERETIMSDVVDVCVCLQPTQCTASNEKLGAVARNNKLARYHGASVRKDKAYCIRLAA